MAESSRESTLALLRRIVTALDDKKASDIRVIEMGEKSGVTDFYVIATGTSDPHLRALRGELERVLDEDKVKILGVESQPESGWTVVDVFDVIVHLLRGDQRASFRLELLWKDGKAHAASTFLGPVRHMVSEQAVSLSGAKPRNPVAEKKTPAKKAVVKAPAKKLAAKIPVKKSVLSRTSAEKSKPASEKKLPGRKITAKTKAEGESSSKKPAKKSAVVKAAEKKVIAKKAAKAAKTVRAIAKAKSGTVTRKAKTK